VQGVPSSNLGVPIKDLRTSDKARVVPSVVPAIDIALHCALLDVPCAPGAIRALAIVLCSIVSPGVRHLSRMDKDCPGESASVRIGGSSRAARNEKSAATWHYALGLAHRSRLIDHMCAVCGNPECTVWLGMAASCLWIEYESGFTDEQLC
jgi:hypothetical protein